MSPNAGIYHPTTTEYNRERNVEVTECLLNKKHFSPKSEKRIKCKYKFRVEPSSDMVIKEN